MPASSRDRLKPTSRARTVTTTKLMLNMMWLIRMVLKPRSVPIVTHRVSSDAPRMTSGAVIGMKIRMLLGPEPRNRYRVRARPIIVPTTVAKTVEMTAMARLVSSGPVMSGRLHTVR